MKKSLIGLAALFAALLLYRWSSQLRSTAPAEADLTPDASGAPTAREPPTAARAADAKPARTHAPQRQRPDEGVRADPEVVRAAMQQLLGAKAAAQGSAPATPGVAPSASAAANEQRVLAPHEASVAAMYERMARALDSPDRSCDAIGEELLAIVERDRAALAALDAAWAPLTPDQRRREEARIEAALGGRLDELRQSFRVGLAKCPEDPGVRHALRSLAGVHDASTTP